MNNEQDNKSTVSEPTKPGPKYYLTRPATPVAIKIATLRPLSEQEK